MHIYICTSAVTTTTISSVCPKCGIIVKSGKISCCGDSGSWFGKCGSAGNAKLDHTWYEGIQACKTLRQSEAATDRQSNAAQQRKFSNGLDMANSKADITPANTFTSMLISTSSIIAVKASINKSTATLDTTIITLTRITTFNTSTNVPMTSPAHTRPMATTVTVTTGITTIVTTTTATYTTATMTVIISRAAKETAITADWISQGVCYTRAVPL